MRHTKWIGILTLAMVLGFTVNGAEVVFKENFDKIDAQGQPAGWKLFDWRTYLPYATVEVTSGHSTSKVLHLFNVKGKSGTLIRSKTTIPCKAGDKVTVTFQTRGTGRGFVELECLSDRKGFNTGLFKSFKLTEQWKSQALTFVIQDGKTKKTEFCQVDLGCAKDSDIQYAALKASIEKIQPAK